LIIDAHTHLGISEVSGLEVTEEQLLLSMDNNKVDMSLVIPLSMMKEVEKGHTQIVSLCTKYPQRFKGIADINPLLSEERYFKEAQKWVQKADFIALKFHPLLYPLSPLDEKAEKVFQTARKLEVPVIIHTGIGVPNALPSLCIPAAKRYKEVKIVLAHAGSPFYTREAYVVAWECENVYLETSWCQIYDLKFILKRLGTQKIMMGSDLPDNLPLELTKYHLIGLKGEKLEQCFYRTAAEVFKLNK